MAKDFSNVNTNPVYDAIAEATQEPQKRRPRREYDEAEAAELAATMKTQGRKGVKMPRINLAFTPENHAYIETMSRIRGESLTTFVNRIIDADREANAEKFKMVLEFQKQL